jgi:hypothetical protein
MTFPITISSPITNALKDAKSVQKGIWKFKQLFLDGAGAAVSFWLFEEN